MKKTHKGWCITGIFIGSRSPRTLGELGRRCKERNEGKINKWLYEVTRLVSENAHISAEEEKKAVAGSQAKCRRPAEHLKWPHSHFGNGMKTSVTCFEQKALPPVFRTSGRFIACFQTTRNCFVKCHKLHKVSRDVGGGTRKELRIIAVHSDRDETESMDMINPLARSVETHLTGTINQRPLWWEIYLAAWMFNEKQYHLVWTESWDLCLSWTTRFGNRIRKTESIFKVTKPELHWFWPTKGRCLPFNESSFYSNAFHLRFSRWTSPALTDIPKNFSASCRFRPQKSPRVPMEISSTAASPSVRTIATTKPFYWAGNHAWPFPSACYCKHKLISGC